MLLQIVLVPPTAYGLTKWHNAKIKSTYAIVYSDRELTSPVGKIMKDKQVVAVKKPLEGGVTPILIAGRIAYIESRELNYTDRIVLQTQTQSRKSLMTFFSLSKGTLNQKTAAGDELTYDQNSPMTLGLFGNYRPAGAAYSFQSSVYGSQIKPGTVSSEDEYSVPMELGANVYYQYEFPKFALYGGVDYERLSYFKIRTSVEALEVKTEGLTYATAGVGFNVKSMLLKASFSQIGSSTGELSGHKVIFYLGYFTKVRWQLHALYKMHFMQNGAGEKLNIQRLGVGFGYSFF